MTQAQVAERMGVTKSRVSQNERGKVSTIEAVARYVHAIGGRIQISAVFGDDHYVLRGTVTEAARPLHASSLADKRPTTLIASADIGFHVPGGLRGSRHGRWR